MRSSRMLNPRSVFRNPRTARSDSGGMPTESSPFSNATAPRVSPKRASSSSTTRARSGCSASSSRMGVTDLPSGVGRGDLLLQDHESVDEALGRGGASGDQDVHGDDLVYALEHGVRREGPSRHGAVAHGDDPLRV